MLQITAYLQHIRSTRDRGKAIVLQVEVDLLQMEVQGRLRDPGVLHISRWVRPNLSDWSLDALGLQHKTSLLQHVGEGMLQKPGGGDSD
jgi:hypothetical protein